MATDIAPLLMLPPPPPTNSHYPDILLRIKTPYNADAFEGFFQRFPHLRQQYPNLVLKLRKGFPMGEFPALDKTVTWPNGKAVEKHRSFVDEYFVEEVKEGRLSGPYSQATTEQILGGPFQCSPITVKIQPQNPGEDPKLRVCIDLSRGTHSYPATNDYSDMRDFPTKFDSALQVAEIVASAPNGAQAMTLDISKFHRRTPLCPAHKRWFVIQSQPGQFYVQHACPFGAKASEGNSGEIANAALAIWKELGVGPVCKWADDMAVFRFPLPNSPRSFPIETKITISTSTSTTTTMSELSFKGHTVVITGAGGGLGKAYSLLFASRGANVVVNDFNGAAAQKVVDEIVRAGGKAVVNTSSVTDGAAVIKTAVDNFGTVTILLNNAGILRDKGFKNMTDKEWDQINEVHLKGAFSCTKAAWPIFRKQKFGRVINTASAAGLYGNFGQANYSAAKAALIGFSKTLAREGAKYGIKSTAIAPLAASAMTETVMPPEMFVNFKPEFVAPFVAAICHPDGPDASGKVFEVGAGYIAEIRWERSNGAVMKTDASFTPSAVKAKWSEITDFSSKVDHPNPGPDVDAVSKLKIAAKLPPNAQASPEVRFDGQTAIVTGSGGGLGRAYAHLYARLGANVVINDVNEKAANAVVDEIVQAGGKAAAAVCSAEEGEKIVQVALEKFGGVHILVANAGILRDKSFTAMTEQEWDLVVAIHLRATYKCAKAVWPIFQKQQYGRILTTTSVVGIYGNFGQANYSTAKAGIIGLTRVLAIEGQKYNILANTIAPTAGTAMTATVWPQEMLDAFKPDFVAPVVGYLTSGANEESTGGIFEISGGWAAQTRWQRAGGHGFPTNKPLTPEDVIAKWGVITNFDDGRDTHPTTTSEAVQQLVENFGNTGSDSVKAKL